MPAKSTISTKINTAKYLYNDINDPDNSYYVTIGKPDAWSDTAMDFTDDNSVTELTLGPTRTQTYEAQVRQNFMSMKRVEDPKVTHAIRKYQWLSGTFYSAWDSNDITMYEGNSEQNLKIFYVVTDEQKVYKCIKAPNGPSTVKPTDIADDPFSTSDGYIWKFMFTLSAVQVSNFRHSNYIPVKTVVVPDGQNISSFPTADQIQYTTQQNAINNKGKIYTGKVVDGGINYVQGSTTVTVEGDGTGAIATATVTNGVITAINMTNYGLNYNVARFIINGVGTGAKAYPVLSPPKGHGSDPVSELGGFYVMLSFTLFEDENETFIIDNDFRQTCLLKNPTIYGSDVTIATAPTLNAVRKISLSGVTNGDKFLDALVVGDVSGAKAFVATYDVALGVMGIKQNDKTGYKNFQSAETLKVYDFSGSTQVATATVANLSYDLPDVNIFSGDITIMNNHQKINRSQYGKETITFII